MCEELEEEDKERSVEKQVGEKRWRAEAEVSLRQEKGSVFVYQRNRSIFQQIYTCTYSL